MDSLGSLARTVSDRLLRESFRRTFTGTNMSVASVMDGFRDASEDVCMPLHSSMDCAQNLPCASVEIAQGSSFSRNGSGNLKRRNSSARNSSHAKAQRPLLQQHLGNQLHTIRASTSLGPVSPSFARALPAKGRWARMTPRARLALRLCAAVALIAFCIFSGYLSPHLSSHGTLTSMLTGTLVPSTARRLLDSGENTPVSTPRPAQQQQDAYTVRHRQRTESFHASQWDSHMAGRMARQLAESYTGVAGTTKANAGSTWAEGPNADVPTHLSGSLSPPSGKHATSGSSPSSAEGASSISASTQGSASADLAASVALTGDFNSFMSIEGTERVGNSDGTSGDNNISGVSVLQQFGVVSPNNQFASGSGTRTLQYSDGYAQIGGNTYQAVDHTQNAAQCAAACASNARCVAWTRVAGGAADVRRCYLKDSLSGTASATETSLRMHQLSEAVSYGGPSTVVMESGTRDPTALPSALYGCPYPTTGDGTCKPPVSCNCYQGACYGTC